MAWLWVPGSPLWMIRLILCGSIWMEYIGEWYFEQLIQAFLPAWNTFSYAIYADGLSGALVLGIMAGTDLRIQTSQYIWSSRVSIVGDWCLARCRRPTLWFDLHWIQSSEKEKPVSKRWQWKRYPVLAILPLIHEQKAQYCGLEMAL